MSPCSPSFVVLIHGHLSLTVYTSSFVASFAHNICRSLCDFNTKKMFHNRFIINIFNDIIDCDKSVVFDVFALS